MTTPLVIMFLAKAFQTDPRPRQEARSLVEANHSVFVLAWDRECLFPPIEKVDSVIVRSFGCVNFRRSPALGLALGAMIFQMLLVLETVRLISYFKRRPIIHAHDLNTLLPGCFLRVFRLSIGLVYDCHELSYGAYSEFFNPMMGCIIRAIEEQLLRYVDVIITVSDSVANYFRRFDRVTEVIYNCPRIEDIPKFTKEEARVRLGLPIHGFIVSFVGSIRYDCRLELLLAVASVTPNNVHFLVVGDLLGSLGAGSLGLKLGEAARGASDTALTILPRVPRETALSYVLASDLTWAVYEKRARSLNASMTIPWKFFESLACGVPVIVEPGTVRAEMVREFKCGVVLESDDPNDISQVILSLAEHPDQHQKMCAEAKRTSIAMKFNWEAMSVKLVDTYRQLTATSVK